MQKSCERCSIGGVRGAKIVVPSKIPIALLQARKRTLALNDAKIVAPLIMQDKIKVALRGRSLTFVVAPRDVRK